MFDTDLPEVPDPASSGHSRRSVRSSAFGSAGASRSSSTRTGRGFGSGSGSGAGFRFGVGLGLVLLLITGPASALYKVVGADGRVTYTDRPDTANVQSRVVTMNPDTGSTTASPLPLELRQVAARYPVSLYVGSSCQPCDIGRSFLQQRGIPFTEKQVLSNEDSLALEKISGGREAPTLTIGAQVVRGFTSDIWSSYLDAAGYPRESRLPINYQQTPAAPVVARPAGASPTQRLEPTSSGIPVDDGSAAPADSPTGIRF